MGKKDLPEQMVFDEEGQNEKKPEARFEERCGESVPRRGNSKIKVEKAEMRLLCLRKT